MLHFAKTETETVAEASKQHVDPLEVLPAEGPCRGFISTETVRVILLPGYHPTHQLRTVFYSKTFAGVSVTVVIKLLQRQ